jgi:hypothetical protein
MRILISYVAMQKVVCPVISALPDVEVETSGDGRPVSVVVPEAFTEWLRHCESGQLTCIIKGGRQRYKSSAFGAASFVIAQVWNLECYFLIDQTFQGEKCMTQTFEYATFRSKGISSPLTSYCAKLKVAVSGATLKAHARIDRGSAIAVGNFLLFRSTELRTRMVTASNEKETPAPSTPDLV